MDRMSDLSAIFHVKKAGVQYDAHAYTTTAECPEPNLKVNFKGQQAYIKLGAKGSGDVPCYIKTRVGTYQVRKQAVPTVPTGQITIGYYDSVNFVVPQGITTIRVESDGDTYNYIGVTPNSHHLLGVNDYVDPETNDIVYYLVCGEHEAPWMDGFSYAKTFTISWSPEINKHAADWWEQEGALP